MQDERLVALRLNESGEVGLLYGRVDMRVPVILEDSEHAIETDVHARGLDHLLVVRVEPDPAGSELGADVTVGEEHGLRVSNPEGQAEG